MRTGGGPSQQIPLTPTEERIVNILNLNFAVEGLEVPSFGAPQAIEVPSFGAPQIIENHSNLNNNNDSEILYEFDLPSDVLNEVVNLPESNQNSQATNSSRPIPIKKRKGKLTLLKEQIKLQGDMKFYLKKVAKELNEKNKTLKAIKDIEEKKYRLEKKSLEEKEKRKLTELQLKKEELELKKRKIEIKELKNNLLG